MRLFTQQVYDLLNQDTVKFFVLIKLSFNTTYYLTSAPFDITFQDNTYSANSGILEYDSPKFSSVVDREAYRIVVTDLFDEMLEEIENNVVGKEIEVKIGFFDNNGEPVLSPAEVLTVYRGYVDSP